MSINDNNNSKTSSKINSKKGSKKGKTKKYNTKVDWVKVQQEYVETDITLAKLAVKYDVDANTVHKHSKKEGWVSKREEFKKQFTEKVMSKKTDLLSDREIEINNRLYASYNKALNLVDNILDNPDRHLLYRGIYSVDRLEKLTKTMNNIQNGQMLAVGMVPAVEMKKLELMQKKLEFEQSKVESSDGVNQDTSFITALDGSTEDVWKEESGEMEQEL